MFGAVELDLRDAAVAERPARVTATAAFDGVEVVVPRGTSARTCSRRVGRRGRASPAQAERDEVGLVVTEFVAFRGVSVTG